MNEFKRVMYERSEEEMESKFEDLLDSEVVSSNNKLVAYLQTLYEYRHAWALCYRNDLLIRGMQTNNSVESQFLVIKDQILNRTKEVNINGLGEKLCEDLEQHYRTKLLNVSNGKFDGCYADRFKGIGK